MLECVCNANTVRMSLAWAHWARYVHSQLVRLCHKYCCRHHTHTQIYTEIQTLTRTHGCCVQTKLSFPINGNKITTPPAPPPPIYTFPIVVLCVHSHSSIPRSLTWLLERRIVVICAASIFRQYIQYMMIIYPYTLWCDPFVSIFRFSIRVWLLHIHWPAQMKWQTCISNGGKRDMQTAAARRFFLLLFCWNCTWQKRLTIEQRWRRCQLTYWNREISMDIMNGENIQTEDRWWLEQQKKTSLVSHFLGLLQFESSRSKMRDITFA